jgi:hypothetical protein
MNTAGERWYRLPIVWLGATILALCLIGCISLVMLASRQPIEMLPVSGDQVLKVPTARAPEPTPDAPEPIP